MTWATAAFAGGGSTGSEACGGSAPGWDAPWGAGVWTVSNGPTKAIMTALGETRTHSMLSHGPGQWMTHDTMFTPGTNDVCEACDNPFRTGELQDGYPGASQIDPAAIYKFVSGYASIGYNRGYPNTPGTSDGQNQGGLIADFAWNNLPYEWKPSYQNGSYGHWELKWPGTNTRIEYSLHQFKNMEDVAYWGAQPSTNGTTCSGFLAYLQYKANEAEHSWTYYVSQPTYTNAQVSAAANGLQGAVEGECDNSIGFWGDFGAGFACFWCDGDLNICDDAGRQIVWCMKDGDGNCHKGHSDWSMSGATANGISPNYLAGYGFPYGPPATDSGDGVYHSVWSWDYQHALNFNQAGSAYGCWF